MNKTYKALCLLSGGLDSQLAICVLKAQGIHVEAITFSSPFFGPAKGEKAAKAIGVPHHIIDFTEEILEQVQNPAHGLGKAMNPCIDCHTHMIMKAGQLLETWGFDFIATGEVLSQRPMSQNRQSLDTVARCSKYEDLLVRPLCAGLLPPSKPIREGWIDAEKLPAFSGRTRTPQMELAKEFGLTDYPAPAGDCLLTEERFGIKLNDLLEHEGLDTDRRNVWLLSTGRHIRLAADVKIIVGARKEENDILREKVGPNELLLTIPHLPSPTVLAPRTINEKQLLTAAAICARYTRTPAGEPVDVQVIEGKNLRMLNVIPMAPELVSKLLITP